MNMPALTIKIADGFWSRLRGLMLTNRLPENEGLLLVGCSSVHTCFMRYAIDLVYLDRQGRVVRLDPGIRPWRASVGGKHAAHVLELAVGSVTRLRICEGDHASKFLDNPLTELSKSLPFGYGDPLPGN